LRLQPDFCLILDKAQRSPFMLGGAANIKRGRMRRFICNLVLLGALAGSMPARADEPRPMPHFGVSLGFGLPEGADLDFIYRPLWWLRLHGGPTLLTSPGLQAGVTLAPIVFPIQPTLTVQGGYAFSGGSAFIEKTVHLSGTAAQTIQDISYAYGSALLGVEIGAPRRFSVYLRMGLSYTAVTVHNFQTTLRSVANDSTLQANDPIIKATTPTLALGFNIFFG
jgi:hypothetical protein